MKTWTCNRFTGFYPVGAAAVMLAETKEDALRILNRCLQSDLHLPGDAKLEDVREFPSDVGYPEVRILCDGHKRGG